MRYTATLVGVLALALAISAAAQPPKNIEMPRKGASPQGQPSPRPTFDIEKYFSNMEDDVAVYDPASPWVYDGKEAWRRRVDQMFKIRQFLDLNQFHRSEVELGDLKIVTVYREIRRPEGSFTERLHGRITWVYLKKPDGTWSLWHDHTSEIPEDYVYEK